MCAAQCRRGAQHAGHLVVGVQIGCGAAVSARQEVGSWHVRRWINGLEVTREATHDGKSVRRPTGRLVPGQRRPRKHCRQAELRLSALLDVREKLLEQLFRPLQLEAERATDHQVVDESVAQRSHATPPGHGGAMVRRAARSTLA